MYPSYVKYDVNVTPKKILNFTQIFKIIKSVGVGSFGKVYKIIDNKNNKSYALKIINTYDNSIFKEIEMLKTLSIKFTKDVVKYYDYFLYSNKLCILMEYVDGVDADKFFNYNRFGLEDVINFGIWLTNIVSKLHQQGYVHRDIKPANIIVMLDGNYKLIDFGYSCRVGFKRDPLKCNKIAVGSPVFVAPEIWNNSFKKNIDKYYKTADVYACGVTLYNILTKKLPYIINNMGRVIGKQYHYVNVNVIDKNLNIKLNTILYLMVLLNADERITSKEAYKMLIDYKKLG